jgi:hypothetical protein
MTNPGMQTELNYKIQVEPVLFTILNQVAADCAGFNISADDFTRAVWTWADQQLQTYDNPPQWLWTALAQAQQARDADNTIEGEAGDE